MREIHVYKEEIHIIRKHLRSKFDEEEKATEAEEIAQLKKIFDPSAKKEKAAELKVERDERIKTLEEKLTAM